MKPGNTSLRIATIRSENGIRNLKSTKQESKHSDEMFLRLLSKAMYLSYPIKPLVIVPLGVTLTNLRFVHTIHWCISYDSHN
jgi:hypothetical protein